MMYAYPNGYYYYPYNVMPYADPSQDRQRQKNRQNEKDQAENGRNPQQSIESMPAIQPQSFEYSHMQPQYLSGPLTLQQQMMQVERQLAQMNSLIMENNRLLRSLQQMQQRVVTNGGGAVIVRM